MTYLVHAVTPAARRGGRPGLRGAPLEFIEAGAIGVWATALGGPGATRDDAVEHHRIVEDLCAAGPCLPVRFGTCAADPAGVRALVTERAAELAATLARIGRRREVAVTLLWADAPVTPGRGHLPGAPVTPGRAFLERKRADLDADERRRVAAAALARTVEDAVADLGPDVRHVLCPSPGVAVSTSVLAREGGAAALKERLTGLGTRLAGIRVVVSGPWPPYTFASAA